MVPDPGDPGRPEVSLGARPEDSAPERPAPTASPPREAADHPQPSASSPSLSSPRPPTASPRVGRSPLRRARWGGMAAGTLLEAGLARVLFYPTLLYTVFRGKMPGRAHRDWYNRIDSTVLLGALPLRNMTRRLVQDENVRGVITMNEEYETRFLCNSSKAYSWTPDEAVRALTRIRSHIYIRPGQVEVLKEFHKVITAGAAKDETRHTSQT
ncbi:phosphatidylglycerophosphatase and protein-tyrosine phosphatase 1 isoform X2 [Camelus dromedarius]|uniref:Phosphatidylglycerophosphatase and protein-tyrosine phosphatase 1 isoform X2 n=2 Tax=Camelus TaxID=9836 RepID=A0A8B8TQL2_CAMFR|nr:phosphatidylglycerophosphatase and protein-tyrosine phosphatase 1 isoform X2 [Camelus dromedarius]XP_032344554.1 phosphatidylglycerophosphatase and protein-tyrosine phosphatase 1 isoform X2 [Camelus ferus]